MQRPRASVVVASFRDPALLRSCLDSLREPCLRAGVEVIVARSAPPDELRALAASDPSFQWVAVPCGANLPKHRAAGMAVAEGEVVAVIEDHCVADACWLEHLLADESADVVGGPIGNARTKRLIDWAAFFSEYGLFAGQPRDSSDVTGLTSANVAYRRTVLPLATRMAAAGEWENVIHDRLRDQGASFAFAPSALVRQNASYRFWAFCVDRHVHGYHYARRRLAVDPNARRLLLLAGSSVIPGILARRISRALPPAQLRRFLVALPITLAFLAAWATGEARGYLRGPDRPELEPRRV